jgi:hypothetical protein
MTNNTSKQWSRATEFQRSLVMNTTRSTRFGVVASLVLFSFSSVAATQQAYAGPFKDSIGVSPHSTPSFQKTRIPLSDRVGPLNNGPKLSDVIPSGPKVPGPKPMPSPGPAPSMPGGSHHGGGRGHGFGGMAAGLMGGMVLGAIAAQASQARPAVYAEPVESECYIERRRAQDDYGNLYYRKVRVCE